MRLFSLAGAVLIAALPVAVAMSPVNAMHHGGSDDSAMEKPAGDIVDIAIATPDLSTLVAAVQAAGLVDTLKSDGPFTVFAPTNDAFAALGSTLDDLLKPENKDQLVSILTYHVVSGKVKSSALSGVQADQATVQGEAVSIDGTDGVTVNGATVVTADVLATNGVVHIIDAVILPPSMQ